jgi:RNA polymerase sigma factor (sigma-70 family)
MLKINETYHFSDEDLIERYQNSHDLHYLGELYTRYSLIVYGLCYKYLQNDDDAQDATMSIFEKLIKDLKKHKVVSFRPWLHTVAKNYCMMEFRKANSTQAKQLDLKKNSVLNVESNDFEHLKDIKEKDEVLLLLNEGLEMLKDEQKRCVKLFYLDDKSYKEIAEETGLSLNDVKSNIQNGKRNLRLMIEKGNGKK